MPLRITICCCNYLFGENIKSLVEECEVDTDTIITYSDPKEITKEKPDLLITDFNTLSRIIFSDTFITRKVRILLLGTGCIPRIEDECLLSFISHGLVGILSPMANSTQFKKAVKSVIGGDLWFERRIIREIIPGMKGGFSKKNPYLTNREIEVVKMVCNGHTNKEIKKDLNISEQSVKAHLSRIYKKTGVSDRLQLALYAIKSSLFIMNQKCRKFK